MRIKLENESKIALSVIKNEKFSYHTHHKYNFDLLILRSSMLGLYLQFDFCLMVIRNNNTDLSLEESFFKVLLYLLPYKILIKALCSMKANGY